MFFNKKKSISSLSGSDNLDSISDPDDTDTWPLRFTIDSWNSLSAKSRHYTFQVIRFMPDFSCDVQNKLLKNGIPHKLVLHSGTTETYRDAEEEILDFILNLEWKLHVSRTKQAINLSTRPPYLKMHSPLFTIAPYYLNANV